MGYQEKLFSLRQTGVKYSIEPILRLLDRLGNPHLGLNFVHIAGTNGKGSVASMCGSIGWTHGVRTGLYTSPHLVSFRERFVVNGELISEQQVEHYLGMFEAMGWPGTFFEIATAIAMLHFRDEGVGLAVLETGMGGRLDATNVVTPRVSVLTSISLDHTHMLGGDLGSIAAEKAEIIKPGVPAVTMPQPPEVMEVLRHKAAQSGSELREVTREQMEEFSAPLPGGHQRWNTAAAVAAMRIALPGLRRETVETALAGVRCPARSQWVGAGPPVLVDGAHNAGAIAALVESLPGLIGPRPFNLVFGAAADKDIGAMARLLKSVPFLEATILVPIASERSATLPALREHFPAAETAAGWDEAWERLRHRGLPVLVTGSFFLAGEVLRFFDRSAAPADAGEWWGGALAGR